MTVKPDQDTHAAAGDETAGFPSLLDEIAAVTKLEPGNESFALTRTGVAALISHFIEPDVSVDKISKAMIDAMIAEIDQRISLQVDAILHAPLFRKLEAAWRSLYFLVDRTDFRENIRLELLNVSKDELLQDFEDSPEITKSGLYKTVYTAEYGQFGGHPYGNIIANYEFDPGPQDMKLLQYVSNVSAMAHAPFIAAAGPAFFGLDSFGSLANLKDLKSIFEGPRYIKWQSFRESENARYIALTVPRFLVRLPYDPDTQPAKTFYYKENVSDSSENYLWGNPAFVFATRLTDSFAQYRWCSNIIGPLGGGTVDGLPLHQFSSMGTLQSKIPTEVLISDRLEFELAEEGFISLALRKDHDTLCFFSANSVQKPKYFGTGPENTEAALNYKLGSQLPYMFAANRLAHYLKVIQRENIGNWKGKTDLERELNAWIRQYVANQDNPTPEIRSRRPLRQAQIVVEDFEGEAGWYRVGLKVRPHFKYMGAYFTLSLIGKLEAQ